jgi:hypothetical protein
MLMPRIRLEAVVDGLGAGGVGADRVRGEADLHAERDVLGVGLGVDDVAPHAGAVAVDDGRNVGGHARHEGRDDREGSDLAFGGDGHLAELTAAARCAGVAAIEEAGTA